MSKRALRRHHRRRLMQKRKNYWSGVAKHQPKMLRRIVDTPTPCSCCMCSGNFERREFNKTTRQECAADIAEKEQIDAQRKIGER